MKKSLIVRFKNPKNSKVKYAQASTNFLGIDCSTGPLVEKGKDFEMKFDAGSVDTVEFSLTKFADEFDIKLYKKGKLVNGRDK